MTSIVVASFETEAQAIDASHKLIELESWGDITVHEKVIVKKDEYGNTSIVQSETSDGLRTVGGMAIGTLVGALAGPVGALVGMMAGTITGGLVEADYYDFSDDFISKVRSRLQPGKVAIIAEIDEDSPSIVDNSLTPMGAFIFRTDLDSAYDIYDDEQVEAFDEDIASARAEFKAAAAEDKATIQQKIAKLKAKRQERIAKLKEKHNANVENRKTSREEAKKSRLNNRINKHQAKIAELEGELKKLD